MNWNDLIGRPLAHYVILDELGRGGSSRVFRAHDQVANRDVAIKVIPNDAEDRVGFVRRFDREVEVVKQLHHPNIVPVYDRGETDDLVFLVMQLVAGGTLRARMGKPLPLAEACAAIVQMAYALHHAHVRGIIHRDVKPSNMLISADDPRHLLLTDFGIAKIHGQRGLTKSGTTIGTPEYMSPEQAEGKEIDPRADVYSLGCVLYEALAGRPPFVGATPVSVLYQQVHARPPYLRSFNSDVPREVGRIVEQALAKRPDERFGTAQRFAELLLPYAQGAMPALELIPEREVTTAQAAISPLHPLQGDLTHTISPSTGTLKGLGEEGLDALFPEGPSIRAGAVPPNLPQGQPAQNAASQRQHGTSEQHIAGQRQGRPKPTIPLDSFRLPAKPTRPLDLPLTTDGQLDIEALMTRVDAEQRMSNPSLGLRSYDRATSVPLMNQSLLDEWPSSNYAPPYGGATAGWSESPPREPALDARVGPQASRTPSVAARHSTPKSQPAPVWRPPLDDDPFQAGRAKRRALLRRNPILAGAAVAVFLLVSLGIWVGVSASALGLTLGGTSTARPTPTVTATATPKPAPTATKAEPTATPTTDLQKVLNQQAAAAFRAITLAAFEDRTCNAANSQTRFTVNQSVYINLCAASTAPPGATSVYIRQGGRVLYTLASGAVIGPGQTFFVYRYGLSAGSYDVLVTRVIDGKEGVAADLAFTIG